MKWVDVAFRVKRRLQQSGQTPITLPVLKMYGAERQGQIALKCPQLFEARRTFNTVANTAEYAISTTVGTDIQYIYRMIYNAQNEIYPLRSSRIPYPLSSGTPQEFYLRQGTIGLYPTPDTAEDILAFCYRMPPSWGMSLIHDGSANASAATYGIANNTLTLTIVGGANDGTNTFTLTNASYDTISELAAAINTLAIGFTAAASGDVLGTAEASTLLEATESDIGVAESTDVINNMGYLYENPEIPNSGFGCLVEGIIADCFGDTGMDNRYQFHESRFKEKLSELIAQTKKRMRGMSIGMATDVYSENFVEPDHKLPGGWIVE